MGGQRPPAALAVRGLSLRIGGLEVLTGVDLRCDAGEIRGVIGPNGSGKTSLFNCVSGYYRPSDGDVVILGMDVRRRRPHERATLGVGRTFQHPLVDADISVLDNVLAGGHQAGGAAMLPAALRLPPARRAEDELRRRAGAVLDELGLADVAHAPAGALPVAARRRVELAGARRPAPRLRLLDAPAAGLPPGEVGELGALLLRLRADRGLAILLVEHNLGLVAQVADTVTALVDGRVVATGSVADVQRDPTVVSAYLGSAL